MPIRFRLALGSVVGTLLLAVLGGVVFLHQLGASLDAALDATLRTRADAIVQALPEGGEGANFQDSGSDSGLVPPNQAIAQILSMDGSVVDSSEAAGRRALLDRAALRLAGRAPRTLDGVMPSTGEPLRLLAAPVSRDGGAWAVVVGAPLGPSNDVLERARAGVVVTGTAAVVLAGAGAWLLAGLALRPVERMRRTAATISARDAAAQLEVPATRDEVAALAVTFNQLLDRLGQALVRQRAFIADASHELRTPLAVLRTELELARRPGRSPTELAAAVGGAADETDRLVALAEGLLFLARSDDGVSVVQTEPVALAALLATAARAAGARTADAGIGVSHAAPADLVAEVDPIRVRQAVDNLVDNALRWTPRGGRVHLAASRDGPDAVIEVADTGPGFPPDFLPHAFERFRRADVARSRDEGGTGLGLAIVYAIAEAHGGWATASNHPGGGARVRLGFPIRPEAAAAGPGGSAEPGA